MTHDHRKLGVEFNNRAWDLIEKGAARTGEEDRELIAAAHASYMHWSKAGKPIHRYRGETLITRAYAELGQLQPALFHLHEAEHLAKENEAELSPFDTAFAEAIAARVHALAQNPAEAELHYSRAERLAEALDEDERKVVIADLRVGPWFGSKP
jgi:hypothetical protein